jgi:hypothetical protein
MMPGIIIPKNYDSYVRNVGYMDAVFLKMKMEGHVRNVALYTIIGINLDGQKECPGLWISETESAKYWVSVLNELNNRGVQDVLIFTVDNLKGISEAIQAVHESGVRGHIKEPQHPGQYGRPGTGLRQHFRRAILAIGQVRRSVSS